MMCWVCNTKVRNKTALREHLANNPECSDEIEARRLRDLENEVGVEHLSDTPATPFSANNKHNSFHMKRPAAKRGTLGGAL